MKLTNKHLAQKKGGLLINSSEELKEVIQAYKDYLEVENRGDIMARTTKVLNDQLNEIYWAFKDTGDNKFLLDSVNICKKSLNNIIMVMRDVLNDVGYDHYTLEKKQTNNN